MFQSGGRCKEEKTQRSFVVGKKSFNSCVVEREESLVYLSLSSPHI